MDILRRQALDEAREIAPAVVALLLDLDERPRRLALAAAPRVRVAVTSEIPTALMRALGKPLLATPSHPLAKHVIEYADAVRSLADDERDNETARFGKDFWSPEHNVWHSSSLRAQHQRTHQGLGFLRRAERRLSAAAELAERELHSSAISALGKLSPPPARLVAFVESVRYDEATSVLGVAQPDEINAATAPAPLDAIADRLGELLEREVLVETVPAKVFQTESSWGAIVDVSEGPSGSPPEYIWVTSDAVHTPQALQRTTAECIARALLMSSVVRHQSAAGFAWRMRLVTSDRYEAQLAAEKGVVAARPGWQLLHLACEIHMNNSCQRKALAAIDPSITGMIRLALSLRLGGWMREFRRCLFQEVLESLDVVEGASTRAEAMHRRQCVTMFMGVGPRRRYVQSILAALPNGNWSLPDRVQIYVAPGTAWSARSVALLVAKGLGMSLAHAHFRPFNRSRWTMNDFAIGQLGILEACHRLLTRCCRRWLVHMKYAGPLLRVVAYGAELAADPDLPRAAMPDLLVARLDDSMDALDALPILDLRAEGESVGLPDREWLAPREDGCAKDVDASAETHAALNEKNRTQAAAWLIHGDPLRDLTLARVVMEPNMAVLRRQLHIGSDAWAAEQERRCLHGHMQRDREYRLMVAARGELDDLFHNHHTALVTSPHVWSVLPRHSMTEQFLCLAFRMCSRAAGEYERLLGCRHRKPPYRLFVTLLQPELAIGMKDLHRAKPCMLDAWTRDFMDCYDIEAADAKAILRLVLIMANTDTAKIECWHAWTRRVVTRLGAQTTRPNFYDISARCQAQRMKRRAATQGAWVPRSDDSIGDDISRRIHAGDAMEKLDQRPPTKVRRGGGGPWRMHVSRQLQAGFTSFAGHAASYRARGEAHSAQDAIDGAVATGRHRAGEPAFGPSQRQLEVARVRNLAVVFDRQNPISDASFLESHASAIAPSLPEYTAEGLMSLLRVARQVGRMHSARAKLRHQDAQRAIVAYAQGAGRSAMRRATERLPALQQLQGSLHARPVPQSLRRPQPQSRRTR